MRQIKFRGKRVDNGEWVYGSLVNNFWTKSIDESSVCEIFTPSVLNADCWEDYVNDENSICEVDPATVSQFTGLLDKNGKEIYEGDILKSWYSRDTSGKDIVETEYNVEWCKYQTYTGFDIPFLENSVIIGNIHDNPSLLTNK